MRTAILRAVCQSSMRMVSTGTSCTLRSPASPSRNSTRAGSGNVHNWLVLPTPVGPARRIFTPRGSLSLSSALMIFMARLSLYRQQTPPVLRKLQTPVCLKAWRDLCASVLIGPAIAILLGSRDPSAIPGFVVAVVVDTIERHTGRRMTHVDEEAHKRMLTILAGVPPFAEPNTAAAVIDVSAVVRIKATLPHGLPNFVKASLRHAVFTPGHFFLKTPATL